VCDEPISGVDLLPTLCEIAGIPVPDDRAIDGASFLPVFDGKPVRRATPLYWQYNYARTKPKVAMRIGDWKILGHLSEPDLKPGADITSEVEASIKRAELVSFELYNLRDDVGETTDLGPQQAQRLESMAARLRKLYGEIRDESPVWPDWEWPRYEGQRIKAARDAGIWPEWKKPPK
jgi:arylsulfatase A